MKKKQINTDSLRQEIMEPILDSAITCYLSSFSPHSYQMIDWHWHVEFQMCLVTEGTVVWKVGERRLKVPKGGGIFINSQQIHTARGEEESGASFFCIDIHPDFAGSSGAKCSRIYENYVSPILTAPGLFARVISPEIPAEAKVLKVLKELERLYREKEAGFELEMAGAVHYLWKELYYVLFKENGSDSGSRRKDRQEKAERLKDLFLFLQKNYMRKLTLDEIAASVYLSRSECCRFFKQQTGQTIFDYLEQYRMNRSLTLLENSDRNLAEIAAENGFSSQSYYTKRFKEWKGCTPGEYRRSSREKQIRPLLQDRF